MDEIGRERAGRGVVTRDVGRLGGMGVRVDAPQAPQAQTQTQTQTQT